MSALDDFLQHRIPIQLGGMSDPFSYSEMKNGVSLDIMKVLAKHKYPYVISTKGVLLSDPEYAMVLRNSNVYVRFSVTVISSALRDKIDRNCPSLSRLYSTAKAISDLGVPVSLRFQPIFPGYEEFAYEIVDVANTIGVRHISAEYLKVTIDANKMFSEDVKSALGDAPIQKYVAMGAKLNGREYTLPLAYRTPHLLRLRDKVKQAGMTFGFADNDLLIHSDGNSCCSASDLYLQNLTTFRSNIVGIAKQKQVGESITLADFRDMWYPKHPISPYLNSTSRIPSHQRKRKSDWPDYVKQIWNLSHGIYHPAFFVGIRLLDEKDKDGNLVFERVASEFDGL